VSAKSYGCHGDRKICAWLKAAGWRVNDKRVERIWRREGWKVPAKRTVVQRPTLH
jgi:O-methyltransferase involved in polyketide biosynthesis